MDRTANPANRTDAPDPGNGLDCDLRQADEPRTKPLLTHFTVWLDAVEVARALIEQMEPLNPEEAEARERASARLAKLQGLLERDRDRHERPPVTEIALLINLDGHPNRQQAIHDHLVVPLLAIEGTTTRSLRAWANQWISNANTGVCQELAALRIPKKAATP